MGAMPTQRMEYVASTSPAEVRANCRTSRAHSGRPQPRRPGDDSPRDQPLSNRATGRAALTGARGSAAASRHKGEHCVHAEHGQSERHSESTCYRKKTNKAFHEPAPECPPPTRARTVPGRLGRLRTASSGGCAGPRCEGPPWVWPDCHDTVFFETHTVFVAETCGQDPAETPPSFARLRLESRLRQFPDHRSLPAVRLAETRCGGSDRRARAIKR